MLNAKSIFFLFGWEGKCNGYFKFPPSWAELKILFVFSHWLGRDKETTTKMAKEGEGREGEGEGEGKGDWGWGWEGALFWNCPLVDSNRVLKHLFEWS